MRPILSRVSRTRTRNKARTKNRTRTSNRTRTEVIAGALYQGVCLGWWRGEDWRGGVDYPVLVAKNIALHKRQYFDLNVSLPSEEFEECKDCEPAMGGM